LKALGKNDEACMLAPQLVANSPWAYELLKFHLICLSNGKNYDSSNQALSRAFPYFEEFSARYFELTLENRETFINLIEKGAVISRLNFELGNIEIAEELASYVKELRGKLEIFNSQNSTQSTIFNWFEVDALLSFSNS
jgi:hypothetical protein